MQRVLMRRIEDKIRTLCTQLLATDEEDELRGILVELRNALRQHIQQLRAGFANYPFVVERRMRNEILPPDTPAPENAVNETGATTKTDRTKPDSKDVSRPDDSAA
jgi:hypothetical protein